MANIMTAIEAEKAVPPEEADVVGARDLVGIPCRGRLSPASAICGSIHLAL